MDLNQLYFDHQLLLMEADRAGTPCARRGHEVAASHLAGRIGCIQRALGASAARAWDVLATPSGMSLAAPARHHLGYSC